MQPISFHNPSAARIYNNYMARSKKALKILSEKDREESLLEINSHIYEYLVDKGQADEMETLLSVLKRLGNPEETLKEVIAAKKLNEATKTFNPKHLLQALLLNISNGFIYILLFLLFVFQLAFPLLIIMKIISPHRTGLFISNNGSLKILGSTNNIGKSTEILGDLFIPAMIVATLVIYFFIILLLKMVRKTRIIIA